MKLIINHDGLIDINEAKIEDLDNFDFKYHLGELKRHLDKMSGRIPKPTSEPIAPPSTNEDNPDF